MSLSWIFPAELPLPSSLTVELLAGAAEEQGNARIAAAEKLLGREPARAIAKKAGGYELDDELARRLELEGLKLGPGGEFPALSPAGWGRYPAAEGWVAFRARLAEAGAEILGLQLDGSQREALLAFLSRNRVDSDAPPATIVDIARHLFSGEALKVVVRNTVWRA